MRMADISTRALALPLMLAFLCVPSALAQAPGAQVASLLSDPRFRQARAFIKADHERFVPRARHADGDSRRRRSRRSSGPAPISRC